MTASNASIEDAFFKYAKERTGLSPNMLAVYLQKAADYCRLKQPLLGMTDVKAVRNVQQKVAEGKLLRFRYGKDAQTIRRVTQLYYTFIKSYRESKEDPPVQVAMSVNERTTSAQSAPALEAEIVELSDAHAAVAIEVPEDFPDESGAVVLREDTTEERTDDRLFVDFSQDNSYLFTKPVSYTYRGVVHPAYHWIRVYRGICQLLFKDYRETFMTIINGDIPGENTLAFADEQNAKRLRSPKNFAPGYYLEANLDATTIVRKLCGLYNLFCLGDSLKICYRKAEGHDTSVTSSAYQLGIEDVTSDRNYNWKQSRILLVNFDREQSYAFTQPEAYEYKGITRRVNRWGKLYTELCGVLFEDHRDAFMDIMNGDIPGYSALAFADEQHKSGMRAARCFAPGFYLESNMDATSIVRRIRGLYRLFELGGNLRISYTQQSDTKAIPVTEKTDEEWIIYRLRTLKIPYVDNRSADGCLWIASDLSIPIPLSEAAARGYHLRFKNDGCRAFPNRPVIWTKDQPKKGKQTTTPESIDRNPRLEDFRRFLMQDQHLAERTANGYVSALRSVEGYIQEHQLPITILRATVDSVQDTVDTLMSRPDFVKLNNDRHHQFRAAMMQYVAYLHGNVKPKEQPANVNDMTIIQAVFVVLRDAVQPLTFAQIHQEILTRDLYRFNTDNSLSMVQHAIYTRCLTNKERIARGEDVIIQTSQSGRNQYQLMNANEASAFLYGSEATLPTPSADTNPPQPEQLDPKDQGLIERAEQVVLEADLNGITVEELAQKLGAAVLPARKAAHESMNLVMIDGRLIHKDAFVDWDEGADRLEAILDKLMVKNNGYISDAQLYEYARFGMQMFLNDNDMDDQRKVFDMAEHLFEKEGYHGKHYTFWMKTHISRTKETITSKLDIMRKYARDNGGFFRESDLEIYLKSLGIKTASLRQQMKVYEEPIFLFYEPGTFMTSESMKINDDWLSKARSALQKLFDDAGDHIVLRDIQPWWFLLLPELPGSRPWTALLLQSVLFHYSRQVGAKTIYGLVSQTGDTLNAMVVSLDSEIRTFADAVISVLLEDHIDQREFDAEELRQLLVKRGLIAGNELIWNMPKAIPSDERFIWTVDGQRLTINL